jgi:GNAT superfamily N-acetyltransferase
MERLDDLLIVAAGPGDAADLARVHVDAWRDAYAGLLPSAYLARMNVGDHARRWRRRLTLAVASGEFVLAAEGREGLAGFCAGHGSPGGAAAEVSMLYLLSGVRRIGLGRRILASAARVLERRGAESLKLWVLDGNHAARGFYEHLGGRPIARRAVKGWGGDYSETALIWEHIARLSEAG